MVAKVTAPPRSSAPTVVPRSRRWNSRPGRSGIMYGAGAGSGVEQLAPPAAGRADVERAAVQPIRLRAPELDPEGRQAVAAPELRPGRRRRKPGRGPRPAREQGPPRG